MWDRVLLRKEYTLTLLRAATESGHVQLLTPETSSEAKQLADLKSAMQNTVHQAAAFRYALLAEEIYLDGSGIQFDVFRELDIEPDDADDIQTRPLITSQSAEFQEFVRLTDSSGNWIKSGAYRHSPQERANTYAALEPLIWASFRRNDWNLERNTLQVLLDMLVLEPHLIDLRMNRPEEFDAAANTAIARRCSPKKLPVETLRYLRSVLYVAMTKGDVASNELYESEKLGAFYPVPDLSLGRGRKQSDSAPLASVKSDELVAAVGMFVKEIDSWPDINDFSDLLKLRQHKHFSEFRDILGQWTTAITSGNKVEESAVRKELAKANTSMKQVAKCSSIGAFLTYLGLPLLVVDAFFGPVLGTTTTLAGFGFQAYADWQKSRHKWLIVSS